MSRCVVYLQGPTILLNPAFDRSIIDAAYKDDAEVARAEYGGQFRSDVSGYLTDEVIDKALRPGERSRPHLFDFEYVGFVDAAGGGAGGDAMTCAVAHQEAGGRLVLDHLLAIDPPFEAEAAVERCALVLKSFGITSAKADKWGGDWPAQWFQRHGISLLVCDLRSKSALYGEVAPLFVSGLVSLLDDRRLETELRQLERTPRSGGLPDTIDHPAGRGAHDDRINAACGALWMASKLQWSGRSPHALAQPRLHVSGLDYSPLDRYARELERSEEITNSRRPYARQH